jgi:hypothetical protein
MMRIGSIVRGGPLAFGLVAAIAFAACSQAQAQQATGTYSGAAAEAAKNACGEGGAPSGARGPSAMQPQVNATSSGPYSGAEAQAASNACGEGGALGPTQIGASATGSTGCIRGKEAEAIWGACSK